MQKGNTILVIIFIILLIIVAGSAIYFFSVRRADKPESFTTSSTGEVLSIPTEILNNKFGFLSDSKEDADFIMTTGAGWVRMHPGPFLWDAMQKNKFDKIDFNRTDQLVGKYQEDNLGILITIWPFADWDQKNRTDYDNCLVPETDEFLAKNDKKERTDYISQSRCNPNDWEAYKTWLEAIVERYDGDGIDDMPDLKYPVKYWEVLNEPDLSWKSESQGIKEASSLTFYKQNPEDYRELLKKPINT